MLKLPRGQVITCRENLTLTHPVYIKDCVSMKASSSTFKCKDSRYAGTACGPLLSVAQVKRTVGDAWLSQVHARHV